MVDGFTQLERRVKEAADALRALREEKAGFGAALARERQRADELGSRVTQLEKTDADARSQLAEATRRVRLAEERATSAEQRAQAAQARAEELEERLNTVSTEETSTQEALAAAEERVRVAEERAQAAEEQAARGAEELAEAQKKAKTAGRRREGVATKQLESAQAEIADLRGERDEVRARIARLLELLEGLE